MSRQASVVRTVPVLCQKLNAVLPKSKSWHEELECWGNDGGHQVDIWDHSGQRGLFLVRIDVRDCKYTEFVSEMSSVLSDLGLKVEYGERLIAPTVDALMGIILSSKAYEYVENPVRYIRKMGSLGG